MTCTSSTCQGGKKRQYCCTRSSSSRPESKRQCHRRAPPVSSFLEGSWTSRRSNVVEDTCRRGKKRQHGCTHSSSRRIPETKRHCNRGGLLVSSSHEDRGSQARPPSDNFLEHAFTDDSQAHPPSDNDNWSDIGLDVLEHIFKWLSLADILRCRAVCSWWRHCITRTSLNSSPTTTSPPILWLEPYPSNQYFFLDLAKDAAEQFCLPNHDMKQSQMWFCVGYSRGYFLSFNEKNRMCLHRPPLSSPISTLRFPPISIPRKDICFKKAVLWADPISDTSRCGVVLVPRNGEQLMFAKCGDTRFSKLGPNRRPSDIIWFNNCVYVISSSHNNIDDHHMEAWDCSEDGPKKVLDFQPTFSSGSTPPTYYSLHLVESRGELLLVGINRPNGSFAELCINDPTCMVYKMDFKEKKWAHMDSLGDRALFIFEYQTMCLSTQEFPQYEKNTIYFRHYSIGRYPEPRLGVFNMEDGSINEIFAKG